MAPTLQVPTTDLPILLSTLTVPPTLVALLTVTAVGPRTTTTVIGSTSIPAFVTVTMEVVEVVRLLTPIAIRFPQLTSTPQTRVVVNILLFGSPTYMATLFLLDNSLLPNNPGAILLLHYALLETLLPKKRASLFLPSI